jgi:hypothetical protein
VIDVHESITFLLEDDTRIDRSPDFSLPKAG